MPTTSHKTDLFLMFLDINVGLTRNDYYDSKLLTFRVSPKTIREHNLHYKDYFKIVNNKFSCSFVGNGVFIR
jgi:hypothetical protein